MRWRDASEEEDEWLTQEVVAGPLLDAFTAATDPSDGSDVGGDGGIDEESDGEGDSDDGDGDEEGDGNGESAASDERRIARSIFRSIHDRSLSRPTSDTAYSVLTDALPVGPRRCKKPRRQGLCDLCGLLGGVRAIETTRHLALECPYTTLTLEAVLRAVLESTTLDEAVLEEVRGMGREQLVHEYRRLCITGFRLTTGRGQMAEGRIGATPTRVIMLEALAGIVRRRHRNALLAPDDTPDVRVDTIYNEARRALIRTFAHTRRRALDEERAIRLRIPGWQPSPGEGPVAEWETEWLASGFFSSEGECELPETLESVRGVAANGCAVSTVALLCVAPQGEGGTCRVKLRLMVEAPGVVLRPQQQLTERAQRRPPDWVAYTDGSEDLGKAGWAYAVLIGGDAIGDEGASLTSEGYGPVVTSAAHPAYLGARKHTNNTAELTALAELLRALLSSSPQRAGSRGIVRTDSEYAAACMMGRVTPKTNRQLAERLRSLWQRLRAKHTVTWRHVAGHSGNKWNDYVDELAARGRQGDRGSNAAEWADGTIPTNTPDEESSAEGGDSSTIGHGEQRAATRTRRGKDDSDANCGPATPTATGAPAGPVSHPSPATDPEAAPVANPRRAPRVRTIWPEYVPSEQAREIGDDRGARCVLGLDVDPPPPPLRTTLPGRRRSRICYGLSLDTQHARRLGNKG